VFFPDIVSKQNGTPFHASCIYQMFLSYPISNWLFFGGLFCYPLWTPPVNWTPPDSFRPVSARDLLDARDDSGNTALIYAAAKARFLRRDAADGRKITEKKHGKIHHFQ
jgi:hypothetical protein